MLLDEIVQVTSTDKQPDGTFEVHVKPLEYMGQHPYLTLHINIATAADYPKGRKFRLTMKSIETGEAIF